MTNYVLQGVENTEKTAWALAHNLHNRRKSAGLKPDSLSYIKGAVSKVKFDSKIVR